jgi:phage repressor protein C with HTH and peptisase S24 domain
MVGHRLREAMKKAGYTHHLVAKAIGKSRSTIAHWVLENRQPTAKDVAQLAELLNVDINYLMGTDEPKRLKGDLPLAKMGNKPAIHVPVIEGVAGCGASGLLEQLEISSESMILDKNLLPKNSRMKDFAIIRIVGDSMEPYIEEGDFAVIQLSAGRAVVPVNGVYLIAFGESVQIKRCSFQSDGSCLLLSDNQLYPPEKAGNGEWEIVGKVILRIKPSAGMLFK